MLLKIQLQIAQNILSCEDRLQLKKLGSIERRYILNWFNITIWPF